MDSAFGVHPDFKRHVGATMTFKGGKGSAIDVSAKQKLNTESSTTAKLVGAHHSLPLALWVSLFLENRDTTCKKTKQIKTTRAQHCLPRMER